MRTVTAADKRYILTIIDDYSQYSIARLMQHKNDVHKHDVSNEWTHQRPFYLGGSRPAGRLTIKVASYKAQPNSLTEYFLKKEDLGLEDLERILGGKVAAVHAHKNHLHPNEPRIKLQKTPDAQIRAIQTRMLHLLDAS